MAEMGGMALRLRYVTFLLAFVFWEAQAKIVTFRNVHNEDVELFWEPKSDDPSEKVKVGVVPSLGKLVQNTKEAEVFSYEIEGNREMVVVGPDSSVIVLKNRPKVESRSNVESMAIFRNEHNKDVDIFWESKDSRGKMKVGVASSSGGELVQTTHNGHSFSYEVAGSVKDDQMMVISEASPFFVMSSPEVIVHCTMESGGRFANGDALEIAVVPKWSPRGAARFLDLVRDGYYNGVAINRVVPGFLAQFGISPNYEKRTTMRSETIHDDKPVRAVPFQPGYLSYAGSGPDSRTTEIFVVMPDTPTHQLKHFGTNPWETPFGYVRQESFDSVVPKFVNPYGDMPPWGNGPDPQLIYQKGGYDNYLKREFPELAVIRSCTIRYDHSSSDKNEL